MKTVKENIPFLRGAVTAAGWLIGQNVKNGLIIKNAQKDLHKKDPYYELSLIFEGVESLRKVTNNR